MVTWAFSVCLVRLVRQLSVFEGCRAPLPEQRSLTPAPTVEHRGVVNMDVIFSALYRMVKDDALQVMPAPCDRDTPHALWEAERVVEWAPHLGRAGS